MDVLERFGCPAARAALGIDGLLVGELQRWTMEEIEADDVVRSAAVQVGRVVRAWHAWCDAWEFTGFGESRAVIERGLLAGMSGVYMHLTSLRRAYDRRAELQARIDYTPARVW